MKNKEVCFNNISNKKLRNKCAMTGYDPAELVSVSCGLNPSPAFQAPSAQGRQGHTHRTALRFPLSPQVAREKIRSIGNMKENNFNDTVFSRFTSHFSLKLSAFTLAEVLITLGIIGVVAALTIPTLMANQRKKVVETRLAKFYSSINQAIVRSEVDNGDKKYWFDDLSGAQMDDEGKPIDGSSETQKWFNTYLAPYMQILKQEIDSTGRLIVYFPDGSAMKQNFEDSSREWVFYPDKPKKCIEQHSGYGKCSFLFMYYPAKATHGNGSENSDFKYHIGKGLEPFKWNWDGETSTLYENCRNGGKGVQDHAFCTALIQQNGWKIPKDYPFRF